MAAAARNLKPVADTDDQAEAPAKGASAKVAAAKAEAQDTSKSVEWRGLTFKLPSTLPGAILFDIADLDGKIDVFAINRLLKAVIGDTQTRQVRDKVAAEGTPMDEMFPVLDELLSAVLKPYGLTLGE